MISHERYGHRIDVDDVDGTFVVLVDDDEVGSRPNKVDALALGETVARRRYRAAHPVERTELARLDDEPYRAALRDDGPCRRILRGT